MAKYLEDSYCTRSRVEIVSCVRGGNGFHVRLSDTILFPGGGGQPADRGALDGRSVLGTALDGDGALVHVVEAPLELGESELTIDWEWRFDLMQQHSGQHLLSAVALSQRGWRTRAFHLGARDAFIDVEGVGITEAALAALEAQVNGEIRAARAVRARTMTHGEAARVGARFGRIPPNREQLRMVEIEGIEWNNCGGTHVRNLSELQALKIVELEPLRGAARLRFLVGGRLLSDLATVRAREKEVARWLSCSRDGVRLAVERLLSAERGREKALLRVQNDLAEALGTCVAREGERLCSYHCGEADFPLLAAVADAALRRRPDLLVVLTAGQPEDGRFLVAGASDEVTAVKGRVERLFEARGGGRPGRFQGRTARLAEAHELIELLKRGLPAS